MIKSLTGIRLLLAFCITVLLYNLYPSNSFVLTDLIVWSFVFLTSLLLLEIGRFMTNLTVKENTVSFGLYSLSYGIVVFIVITIGADALARFKIATSDKLPFIYIGMSLLLYQSIYFWLRRNHFQQLNLLKQKQRYLQYSFNALKSQNVISFLQKSLDVIALSIEQSPQLAVVQIEKLTTILRYLLQSRDEKFVQLGAELENVKNYCELAELQTHKAIQLKINVTSAFNKTLIPPLVFQLVLDKQFQSLQSTKSEALKIEVYIENNKFVVVKTSNPLSFDFKIKGEHFINNLKQRYQLYNKASGVSELTTNENYLVKFPLVAS